MRRKRAHTKVKPHKGDHSGRGREFADQATLKRHKNCAHDEKRDFKCDHPGCGKEFTDQFNLKRHKSCVHDKERNFRCDRSGCGKTFADPSTLERHKSCVHDKERNFECDYPECGKRNAHKSHLERQKGCGHGKARTFRCAFPNYEEKFIFESTLESHETRAHDKKSPFGCLTSAGLYTAIRPADEHKKPHTRTCPGDGNQSPDESCAYQTKFLPQQDILRETAFYPVPHAFSLTLNSTAGSAYEVGSQRLTSDGLGNNRTPTKRRAMVSFIPSNLATRRETRSLGTDQMNRFVGNDESDGPVKSPVDPQLTYEVNQIVPDASQGAEAASVSPRHVLFATSPKDSHRSISTISWPYTDVKDSSCPIYYTGRKFHRPSRAPRGQPLSSSQGIPMEALCLAPNERSLNVCEVMANTQATSSGSLFDDGDQRPNILRQGQLGTAIAADGRSSDLALRWQSGTPAGPRERDFQSPTVTKGEKLTDNSPSSQLRKSTNYHSAAKKGQQEPLSHAAVDVAAVSLHERLKCRMSIAALLNPDLHSFAKHNRNPAGPSDYGARVLGYS